MPDCQDVNRQNLIHSLAQNATVEACQTLLEKAIHNQDSETIETTQWMLEKAFAGNLVRSDSYGIKRAFCADVFQSYLKTAETVAARGTPLMVKSGECQISQCPSCFWESICSREATQALIDRGRKLIENIKRLDREAEERVAGKDRAERERAAYIG